MVIACSSGIVRGPLHAQENPKIALFSDQNPDQNQEILSKKDGGKGQSLQAPILTKEGSLPYRETFLLFEPEAQGDFAIWNKQEKLGRAHLFDSGENSQYEIEKRKVIFSGKSGVPSAYFNFDELREQLAVYPRFGSLLERAKSSLASISASHSLNAEKSPSEPYVKSNRWFVPKRGTLRSIEREGIGYKRGYATAELLLAPASLQGDTIPMVDLRAHHLYGDTYAGNVGIIGRKIFDSRCRIFGVNAYYDFRQGCMGNYNQLGLGTELLCKRWEFRVNGYIPLGRHEHEIKCVFDDFDGDFFAIFRRREFSLSGFNGEAGYMIVKSSNFLLYAAAGPYYLSGSDRESWGGRVRVRPQFRDYLALEFVASHDGLFGTNYQGQIIVNVPFYEFFFTKNKKQRKCVTDRQIYQPVERFEIIPLKKHQGWKTNF